VVGIDGVDHNGLFCRGGEGSAGGLRTHFEDIGSDERDHFLLALHQGPSKEPRGERGEGRGEKRKIGVKERLIQSRDGLYDRISPFAKLTGPFIREV